MNTPHRGRSIAPLGFTAVIVILVTLSGSGDAVSSSNANVGADSGHGIGGEDLRQYQHGIELIATASGGKLLVWSSSSNPPTGAAPDGSWTHNVYAARITGITEHRPLIVAPEAQEPVSAAVTTDGHIMVTVEDGWNSDAPVAQRFGIYDANLRPILPYPQLIANGGHSGHVAAVGKRFIVFYSQGWIKGGGVDGLGSGRDVFASVYSSNGRLLYQLPIATGGRDWWPLIAASNRRALLLWQRLAADKTSSQLMYAILDPTTRKLSVPPTLLADSLRYYVYAASYVPAVNRFLITGTTEAGSGFAYLLTEAGARVAQNLNLPATVREAWPAVKGTEVLQLTSPSGALVLSVDNDRIEALLRYDDDYVWQGIGAVADFSERDHATVYALSKSGMVVRRLTGR